MSPEERIDVVLQAWHQRVGDDFVPHTHEAEDWLAQFKLRHIVAGIVRTGQHRARLRRRGVELQQDELIYHAEQEMQKLEQELEQTERGYQYE